MEGQIKLEAPTGLKLILFYFQAAATNAKTQPTRNRGSFMIHYIPSNTRSPYTLHITHTVAPAWRSRLWGPIYTNCDSWKHIHTHTHRGVVYYHCDLEQETRRELMSINSYHKTPDRSAPKNQHRDQILSATGG